MRRKIGDRRKGPRFDLVGELWGSLDVSSSLPIVNLAAGGALLQSAAPLPRGSVHSVLAVTADESHEVTVRVRHSLEGDDQGHVCYLIGVEFVDVSPALAEFLDRQLARGDGARSVEA
jgi:hypothetical protein